VDIRQITAVLDRCLHIAYKVKTKRKHSDAVMGKSNVFFRAEQFSLIGMGMQPLFAATLPEG
jgi:hypothetical protein